MGLLNTYLAIWQGCGTLQVPLYNTRGSCDPNTGIHAGTRTRHHQMGPVFYNFFQIANWQCAPTQGVERMLHGGTDLTRQLGPLLLASLVTRPGLGIHGPSLDTMNVLRKCVFDGQFQGFRLRSRLRVPVAEPHSQVSSGAQAAAALTFPMSTNSHVFLNVNGLLCPLLGAGLVRTHCGG